MARLVYNRKGRLLFTREMRREYTILLPQMLEIHFELVRQILVGEGLKVEILRNEGRAVVDEGLKHVHNDTCYPALLVIGQIMNAIRAGGYDLHRIAIFMPQTGGGCRASNYIHLLRRALRRASLEFIPVISVSFGGLEYNPGFSLRPIFMKVVFGMLYGDVIMNAANQTRPYEAEPGATDAVVARWIGTLSARFSKGRCLAPRHIRGVCEEILDDFAAIPVAGPPKARVGIVGEIYVKFSPLGNNNLERFLLSEGVEPVVPGVVPFVMFKIHNRIVDGELYGASWLKRMFCRWMMRYITRCERDMIAAYDGSRYRPPARFEELRESIRDYLGEGCKMGEGWLLTAEMLELIHSGTPNIVCAQPFGCLPNHIVGKGMIRALKDRYPAANIVAVDYDPSATAINQENRIKLMLSSAF